VPSGFDVSAANSTADLQGILALQRQNLAQHVSAAEAVSQGFVTVGHTLAMLEAMHAVGPSIVARARSSAGPAEVVGYALMMPREARSLVPILEPMFELLASLSWQGRPLSTLRYYVMGQVCVAKAFRGQGVFDALYQAHAAAYRDRFDLIVTEVALRNTRSMRAHERVGFAPIHRYRDDVDDWQILGWDFGAGPSVTGAAR
jgi:GNAT superfamily N-acetyltransferase